MKRALRGGKGQPLTLLQYVRAEGGVTDPKAWVEEPSCPSCGARVHPYDMKGALGFRDASREVNGRPSRRGPGFDHADHAASLDCPLSFPADPRYAELSKQAYDSRRRDEITTVLKNPVVEDFNSRVLRKLIGDLTCGQGCATLDQEMEKAMRRLCTMELLGSNPWALSYLVARLAGVQTNVSARTGQCYQTVFESVGIQEVAYLDHDGQTQWGRLPRALRACFVNTTRAGKTVFTAMGQRQMYELTPEAAGALAYPGKPELARRALAAMAGRVPTRTRSVQLGLF